MKPTCSPTPTFPTKEEYLRTAAEREVRDLPLFDNEEEDLLWQRWDPQWTFRLQPPRLVCEKLHKMILLERLETPIKILRLLSAMEQGSGYDPASLKSALEEAAQVLCDCSLEVRLATCHRSGERVFPSRDEEESDESLE